MRISKGYCLTSRDTARESSSFCSRASSAMRRLYLRACEKTMCKCTSVAYWIARQNSGVAIQDRFPGGKVMYLLYNFFEGSNEERMGRQQKEEVL